MESFFCIYIYIYRYVVHVCQLTFRLKKLTATNACIVIVDCSEYKYKFLCMYVCMLGER